MVTENGKKKKRKMESSFASNDPDIIQQSPKKKKKKDRKCNNEVCDESVKEINNDLVTSAIDNVRLLKSKHGTETDEEHGSFEGKAKKKKKKKHKKKEDSLLMDEQESSIAVEEVTTHKKKKKKHKHKKEEIDHAEDNIKEINEKKMKKIKGKHTACDGHDIDGHIPENETKTKKKKNDETDVQNDDVGSRNEDKKKKKCKHGKHGKEGNGIDKEVIQNGDSSLNEGRKEKKKKKKKRKYEDENLEQDCPESDEKSHSGKKMKKLQEPEPSNISYNSLPFNYEKEDDKPKSYNCQPFDYGDNDRSESGQMKSPVSAGQWSTASLGSDQRQQKFLRLLGGFKKAGNCDKGKSGSGLFGKLGKHGGNAAMDKNQEEKFNKCLETDFDKALSYKFNKQKSCGLGFEAPPGEGKKFYIDKTNSKSIKFDDSD